MWGCECSILTVSGSTSGEEDMEAPGPRTAGSLAVSPEDTGAGWPSSRGKSWCKRGCTSVVWLGLHPPCPSPRGPALGSISLLSFPNKRSLPWAVLSICRALCSFPRDQLMVAVLTLSPFKALREHRSHGSRAKPKHVARHLPSQLARQIHPPAGRVS